MESPSEDKLAKLTEYVKQVLGDAPGCHDFAHTSRVLHNALLLAEYEKVEDVELIKVAALLHDIARPEEMKVSGAVCHATIGAERVPEILRKFGWEDECFIQNVAEMVRKHRYRGNDIPETLEEKIIFDADKLDSVGTVGIGRAFHFAGHIGAKLHNKREEALGSGSYSLEDSAYREYLVKLRKIPERMLTATGKKVAEKRAEFMDVFFERLNMEVFGTFRELG